MSTIRSRAWCLAMLAVASLVACPARAALIAYEGFDYGAATEINGQNGGSGFAGAWASSPAIGLSATSLAYPTGASYTPVGGSISDATAGGSATRMLSGSIDASQEGLTVYTSVLLNKLVTTASAGYGFFQFDSNSSVTDAGTIYMGVGTGGVTFSAGDRADATPTMAPTGGAIGLTYLMVRKIIFHAGTTPDEVFLKVYTPTDTVGSEPTADAGWSAVSHADAGNKWSAIYDRIRFDQGANARYALDEIRVGTTWSDVAYVVPEPSAMVMMAAGAFSLLMYGWRRRK